MNHSYSPGDLIVIYVNEFINKEQCAEVKARVLEQLPPGAGPVIVLPCGMIMEVVPKKRGFLSSLTNW